MDYNKLELHEAYDKITRILYFELINEDIETYEFYPIRDYAIKKLYPDTFRYIKDEAFICMNCAKTERSVMYMVRLSRDNHIYNRPMIYDDWVFVHFEALGRHPIRGISACSTACLDVLKERWKEKIDEWQSNSYSNFGRDSSESRKKFIDIIADEIIATKPDWFRHLMILSQ